MARIIILPMETLLPDFLNSLGIVHELTTGYIDLSDSETDVISIPADAVKSYASMFELGMKFQRFLNSTED